MPDTAPVHSGPRSHARAEPASASDSATSAPVKMNNMVSWVVACGMFINQLDSTVLTTSLPQIAESLDVAPVRLSLAITSYLITLAVFIPISGWIADKFGPRRVFCWAIFMFTFSSAMCGFATSLQMLVMTRICQGFGGALMTPVGRIILGRSFPKEQLYAALAFVSIPALIGPTIGPLVGGFITTYLSWRWIFFLNIPFGAVGIVLALRYVRNFETPPPARFDFTGFVIVGAGLALLELAIDYLGHHLVGAPVIAGLFTAGVTLLGIYAWYALSRDSAVLDLNLFRLRAFRSATVWGGLCRMTIGAVPFMLPLMLQVSFGLSAMGSGLITFVMNVGAIGVKTIATRLARRFGFRNLLLYNASVLGLMAMGIGIFFHEDTPHWMMIVYLLLYGIVRSVQFTNVNALTYVDLNARNMSKGTSMASVVQQLSNSFGIATGATVLSLVAGSEVLTQQDFFWAFIIIGLFPIVSVVGFFQLKPEDGAEMAGRKR